MKTRRERRKRRIKSLSTWRRPSLIGRARRLYVSFLKKLRKLKERAVATARAAVITERKRVRIVMMRNEEE